VSQPPGARRDEERWTPDLHFHATGGRCRLSLGGYTYGDGSTLQQAADDLVARLLMLAKGLHSGAGFVYSSEVPPLDMWWYDFLYELGEMAGRGEDIRPRVFGAGDSSTGIRQ
jgi:hypothetical protein